MILAFSCVMGLPGARAALRTLMRLRGQPLRGAGIGRGKEAAPAVRTDQIAWVEDAEVVARFEALRLALNEAAWLGLERFDLQLARYDAGAGYERHRDAFRGSSSRRLTATWYLNADWQPSHGGILRLHLAEGSIGEPSGARRGAVPCEDARSIDIEPVLDRLVVFLSERIDHEVLPAHAPRWALTAWYHGPAKI